MPFVPDNGTPAPRQYDDPPPLRVGGLWPSKSGKALTGNIMVAEPRRPQRGEQPSDVLFGDVLIDLIKQCMEEKKPLRILVFESKYVGGNAPPYSLNVTVGQVRTERPGDATPVPRKSTWGTPAAVPLPEDDESSDDPEPEPTPRPIRRGAPRR